MMGLYSDSGLAGIESINKSQDDLNISGNDVLSMKTKNEIITNGEVIKVNGKEITTAEQHGQGDLYSDEIDPLNPTGGCQSCMKKNERKVCKVLLDASDDSETYYVNLSSGHGSCSVKGTKNFNRKGIGLTKVIRGDEALVGWSEPISNDTSQNCQAKKEIIAKSKDKQNSNGALGPYKELPLWKDYRLRNDISYVFRHYTDLSKYIEQYRDEHTLCGKADIPISPSTFQQKTTNHYEELVKKSEQETEIVTLPRILKALAQGSLISIVNNNSNNNSNNSNNNSNNVNNNRLLGYVKPNPGIMYDSNLLHKYKLAPKYRHQRSLPLANQTGIPVQTENDETPQPMSNYNVQFRMPVGATPTGLGGAATPTCLGGGATPTGLGGKVDDDNNNNSRQNSCHGDHSKQTPNSQDARISSAKQTIHQRASGTVNLTPTQDKLLPNRTRSNTPPNPDGDAIAISNYAPFHPSRTRKQRSDGASKSSKSDGGSTQQKKCTIPAATDEMWSPVNSLTLDKMAGEKPALVQTWFDAKGRSYVHTMDRYPVFRK